MIARAVAVLAVVAASTAAGASPASPRLQTIAVSPTPVDVLAQDGSTVAWGWVRDGLRVTVRSVRTGLRSTTYLDFGAGGADRRFFALAGTQALWATTDSGNFFYLHPKTAAPGRVPRSLGELVYDNADLVGTHAGGAAGDGSTLVFSTVEVGVDPTTCNEEGLRCTPIVTGGGLHRVVGPRRVDVPGPLAAFLLAASGRNVAAVEAFSTAGERFRRLGPGRAVEIRDAVTGRRSARFVPEGTVRALALTPISAAVLVTSDGARRIERYALDGRKLSSTPVPAAAADELGASRSTVVFRVGRSIRALDVRRGSVRTVATARSRPVGLSIESNRVMWAEQVGGRWLVRALWL